MSKTLWLRKTKTRYCEGLPQGCSYLNSWWSYFSTRCTNRKVSPRFVWWTHARQNYFYYSPQTLNYYESRYYTCLWTRSDYRTM